MYNTFHTDFFFSWIPMTTEPSSYKEKTVKCQRYTLLIKLNHRAIAPTRAPFSATCNTTLGLLQVFFRSLPLRSSSILLLFMPFEGGHRSMDTWCSCALADDIYCKSVDACLYQILQQHPYVAPTYIFGSLHSDHHIWRLVPAAGWSTDLPFTLCSS